MVIGEQEDSIENITIRDSGLRRNIKTSTCIKYGKNSTYIKYGKNSTCIKYGKNSFALTILLVKFILKTMEEVKVEATGLGKAKA